MKENILQDNEREFKNQFKKKLIVTLTKLNKSLLGMLKANTPTLTTTNRNTQEDRSSQFTKPKEEMLIPASNFKEMINFKK